MQIFLDFDGRVVEHYYPLIGAYNPGCKEVISKLQKAVHLFHVVKWWIGRKPKLNWKKKGLFNENNSVPFVKISASLC